MFPCAQQSVVCCVLEAQYLLGLEAVGSGRGTLFSLMFCC